MKRNSRLVAILAVLVSIALPVLAEVETFNFDKAHTLIGFRVRHVLTKVEGRFKGFDGTIWLDRQSPAASKVELTIQATTIDTGVENRDNDLRSANYFDVAKYPTITFKSSKVTPAGKDKFTVEGSLTMHGVAKQVSLPVEFLGFGKDPWGNDKAGFAVETVLNRKDYGLNWNKALDQGGFLLGDDVKVVISLEAAKKKN